MRLNIDKHSLQHLKKLGSEKSFGKYKQRIIIGASASYVLKNVHVIFEKEEIINHLQNEDRM